MKRDMDAVRDTLLWMEGEADNLFEAEGVAHHMGVSHLEMIDRLRMMASGGLVNSTQPGVFAMTWEGYDFLENVRDPVIWRKTKEAAKKAGSWSLQIVAGIAAGYVKQKAQDLGFPIA